jgi:UDP-glucuronate 4-epimerase
MSVLVTGAAGFIGFHVCRALLARGDQVIGVDNLNDYYDVALKEARLAGLEAEPGKPAYATPSITPSLTSTPIWWVI